jgi:hypothetical protein
VAFSPLLAKLCIDQTGKTFVDKQVQAEVLRLIQFTLRGFNNPRLTLSTSAYCFYILCEKNRIVLVEHAEQIVAEVMQQDFVSQWDYQPCF